MFDVPTVFVCVQELLVMQQESRHQVKDIRLMCRNGCCYFGAAGGSRAAHSSSVLLASKQTNFIRLWRRNTSVFGFNQFNSNLFP